MGVVYFDNELFNKTVVMPESSVWEEAISEPRRNDEHIVIERLSSTSSPFIVELIQRNLEPFEESGNVLAATFRRLENLDEVYGKEGACFFVARDSRVEPAGYIGGVGLGPLHGLPASEGFGEIRDLVLEKSYRGHGIGAKLLEMGIDKAISIGYEKLYLETVPNMVTARRLFQRFGFRPVTSKLKNTLAPPPAGGIDCYYLLEIKDLNR